MNKELLKGTTDMMILKALDRQPMYGYGMIKHFEIMSNGVFSLKEGTLYPILHALEKKEHIESYWDSIEGRKRKYYKITDKGRKNLNERQSEWQDFTVAMKLLME
ncbi:PadR family transcriptional regulator [Fusibacter ferrireducens]|uniref:Helix-turn-helix transcriptional regulator n=1 Tax=Fusibacter ferrireducens TaxID=2785058 RepID=A0ABR9ZQ40_9FIRM|nr:helix-turn-helix transcriptional regulator [Fusibacter ferrireducens]MBF4692582.1 helix-turn-helix transcriptional regulator [Fusibacter ferrireducens]